MNPDLAMRKSAKYASRHANISVPKVSIVAADQVRLPAHLASNGIAIKLFELHLQVNGLFA